MKVLSALLLLLTALSTFAFDCQSLGELPLLHNGRVRPLILHAKESVPLITGHSTLNVEGTEKNSLQLFCEESLLTELKLKGQMTTKITHPRILKMIGDVPKSSTESDSFILEPIAQMSFSLVSEIQKSSGNYKSVLESLLSKLQAYQEIAEGKSWQVAALLDNKIIWLPLSQFKGNEVKSESDLDELYKRLLKSKDDYQRVVGKSYLLELTYSDLHLTAIALTLVAIALFMTLFTKKSLPIVALSTAALLTQIAVFIFRGIIAHRAPITNMFETVYFAGTAALILGLVLGHLKKDRLLLISALVVNLGTLLMVTIATEMISDQITPLVPILRNNFWLSIHVSTMVLSYAAFAVAFILGNFTLLKNRFSKRQIELSSIVNTIHAIIIGGTVLLTLGIILGALWADYAWGRFWGWDPKESWSLITLFVYLIILHGKGNSWLTAKGFITTATASFLVVMMAWFGVNFILSAGLHSYGFSQGGALFITLFFIAETAILLVTNLRPFRSR